MKYGSKLLPPKLRGTILSSMKNFFTRKSLRGKISILTIITSLLAMFLVIGAVFSLKYQRYSKDELFKFKAQAELLARTLGSLHPTPAELRDTGLDFFFKHRNRTGCLS